MNRQQTLILELLFENAEKAPNVKARKAAEKRALDYRRRCSSPRPVDKSGRVPDWDRELR